MIDRLSVAAAGLGLLLLTSMALRCVVAAQSPNAPAATVVAQAGAER